ncbi:MAG TPA: bifunctional 5,10-methylenetetrahydrofolate dehydrogenase/5,10-methenyltetrahydrofolate cyclohydrolase [Thermoanaerobaculia bacterium]|nr:bifunctional 5,10-methylenetetrahydrofolate dehydrogenase/5,10-methenyltetrahydrofolate cyclohydrolase [Thermoanaerobaculia bacterium]
MTEARLLDGKGIAADVEREVRTEVEQLSGRGIVPGLVAVCVGTDPASEVYVRNKARKATELGFRGTQEHFPGDMSQSELMRVIERLNGDDGVDGILVQLPLPPHIDSEAVLRSIEPAKDVDGFHPVNVGLLHLGTAKLVPCTPAGIMRMLESTGESLRGMHAVVVGRSNIVGKPVAALLLQKDCTVTICHSRTRELPAVTRQADILIAALGRPLFVTGDMIRDGAIVIDVGINRIEPDSPVAAKIREENKSQLLRNGKSVLAGDVDFPAAFERASWVTPVPGGVGPMTIAMLMKNTVTAARERRG